MLQDLLCDRVLCLSCAFAWLSSAPSDPVYLGAGCPLGLCSRGMHSVVCTTLCTSTALSWMPAADQQVSESVGTRTAHCIDIIQDLIHGAHSSLLIIGTKVKPRLSGPLLSGSLAIRKKIVGYRFTAYAMHTYSMCVRLPGSLAYPDILLLKTNACGYARSDYTVKPVTNNHPSGPE